MNEETGSGVTLWSDIRFCSPWVLTVWSALKEKNIPFRVKTIDYRKDEHLAPEFLSKNPFGKIPVIEHDGVVLAESSAILEYLEDVFDGRNHPPIYPQDPETQAEDRMILSWLRTDLAELRNCFPYESIFIPNVPHPAPTPLAEEQARDLIQTAKNRMQKNAGMKPTIADLELASTLRRLIHHKFVIGDFPDVIKYSDTIWMRPSIQSWVTHDRVTFLLES